MKKLCKQFEALVLIEILQKVLMFEKKDRYLERSLSYELQLL